MHSTSLCPRSLVDKEERQALDTQQPEVARQDAFVAKHHAQTHSCFRPRRIVRSPAHLLLTLASNNARRRRRKDVCRWTPWAGEREQESAALTPSESIAGKARQEKRGRKEARQEKARQEKHGARQEGSTALPPSSSLPLSLPSSLPPSVPPSHPPSLRPSVPPSLPPSRHHRTRTR